MRKIFIILICLLIASPSLAGTSALFDLWKFFKEGKMIKIPSYNSGPFPNEFITLKDGSYKKSPVKIDGKSCKIPGWDPVKEGHQMDVATCFQYYNPVILEYIASRIK